MNIAKAPKLATDQKDCFFAFNLDTGSIMMLYKKEAYGADFPKSLGVRASSLGASWSVHCELFFDFCFDDILSSENGVEFFLEDLCNSFRIGYCFDDVAGARDFFEKLVTGHQKNKIFESLEIAEKEEPARRRM